jgi:hypothetical protein
MLPVFTPFNQYFMILKQSKTQNMSIHITSTTPAPLVLIISSSSSFNKISTRLFIMREDAWDWDGAN